MKQSITLNQLNELSQKGKEKYWEYSKNKNWRGLGDYELWSIGYMIEFLGELDNFSFYKNDNEFNIYENFNNEYMRDGKRRESNYKGEQLCDELWRYVKSKLEKEGNKL